MRLKRGRTYNFTAESGNPDELYVFHEKVSRVR
jgi:hypothetical protein